MVDVAQQHPAQAVLYTAYELLAPPDRWIQWEMATREDGCPCHPLDPQAAKFCLEGALRRARFLLKVDTYDDYYLLGRALQRCGYGNMSIVTFNDRPRRTKQQILEVVKLASELLPIPTTDDEELPY
jgi:hypothetical protein